MKKILVIGDSFVEGIGAPQNHGWAFLLKEYLSELQIVISGIGGDNSIKLLNRIPSEIYDFYLLQLGTNDSRYRPSKKTTEIPEKDFEKNLLKITSKIRSLNNKSSIFTLGTLFVDESRTVPYKEDKVYSNFLLQRYNKIIHNFSLKNNVYYISLDFMSGNNDYLCDGLHPSAYGHKVIFDCVRNQLLKFL